MEFEIGGRFYNGSRPLLMGILNVTPDSFSDGGSYDDPERAVDHALKLVGDGADILDIGGESSRPGAGAVSVDEEIERVIPVVAAISRHVSIPVSIDTTKAEVARRALDAGAAMINDISALRFDTDMADVVRLSGCSVVLMHMAGTPRTMQISPFYSDVVAEVLAFFEERISFALDGGISRGKIIVDPGIGFGKTLEHNLEILRKIDMFRTTGCPLMIGVSRKGMIGTLTGAPISGRDWGTAAITSWCIFKGVEIHRVHDVKAMSQVSIVANALRQ